MNTSSFLFLLFLLMLSACNNIEGAEEQNDAPAFESEIEELELLIKNINEENKLLLDESEALEQDNLSLLTTIETLEDDYSLLQQEMESLESSRQNARENLEEVSVFNDPSSSNKISATEKDATPSSFSNVITQISEEEAAEKIQADAEAAWPDNPIRQAFVLEVQMEAYRKLQGIVLTSAEEARQLEKAFEDWEYDFMMLDYIYKEKMKADTHEPEQ